jgi:predicted phage baseplate assembly protein
VDSRSQCYIIRIQADGTTEIVFGDGEEGVRLPSGLENIAATYRSGIGSEGNVAAGSLSLLKTRPLGVVEVTNPLPASGGAGREGLAAARDRAPASVRTLGRIVSLRDFEDFALTFPGIGKAQAVPLWDGRSQFLHLTVAGIGGALVPLDSILYANLVQAIAAVRDPTQRAQVDSYEPRYFRLEAKVVLNPKYKTDKVLAEIESALQQAFSFAVREFGQPVTEAEAIAAISNVAGVVAVDIDALYLRGASRASNPSLEAATAAWDAQKQRVQPAQLLLFDPLDPAGITLLPVTTL